jgi:hypothetical protein
LDANSNEGKLPLSDEHEGKSFIKSFSDTLLDKSMPLEWRVDHFINFMIAVINKTPNSL